MRKVRKELPWVTLAAFSACASLPAAAAQGAQSAEGAQQFLAAMVGQVKTRVIFVDAAGRNNHVTGRHSGAVKTTKGGVLGNKVTITQWPETVVDKQVADVSASVVITVVVVSPCVPAIATTVPSLTASPSASARLMIGSPRARAAASSGCSRAMAEVTTSARACPRSSRRRRSRFAASPK